MADPTVTVKVDDHVTPILEQIARFQRPVADQLLALVALEYARRGVNPPTMVDDVDKVTAQLQAWVNEDVGLDRVPLQPVEPSLPNRWDGFTDHELEALADAVAYADGSTYRDQRWRFAQEIDREQQRRRVPQ